MIRLFSLVCPQKEKVKFRCWLLKNYNLMMSSNELIVPEKCVVFSIPPEDDPAPTSGGGGDHHMSQNFTLKGKEYEMRNIRNVREGQTLMWLCPTSGGDGDKLVPVKIQHFGEPSLSKEKIFGEPVEPWAFFAAVSYQITNKLV